MLEKSSTENSSLIHIFKTMGYNEENAFSHVNDFVSSFGNSLSSIVNGKFLEAGSGSSATFTFTKHEFKVNFVKQESLKNILLETCSNAQLQDQYETRIQKLKSLVLKNESELCAAESVSSGVPCWQIREYDLPKWKAALELEKHGAGPSLTSGIFWIAARINNGVSTTEQLLNLLHALCREEKIVILATADDVYDLPAFLPLVHLIQIANKAKIWEKPIDLLLLSNDCTEEISLLLSENQKQVFVVGQGPLETNSARFHSRFVSGVFLSRGGAVHYIIDSTADLESCVEAIVTHIWYSGTKIRRSCAAFLVVNESVQEETLSLFRKKLENLPDFVLPDHAKERGLNLDAVQQEGIKTIPVDSDFRRPTLAYEIGTSSPLITERVPEGHLLFLIPFRNPAELISLVNNAGGYDKDVALFSSDQSLIRQFTENVQARGIWLNNTPGDQNEIIQNWSLLATSPKTSTEVTPKKPDWRPFLAEAEKGLKNWSSIGSQARWERVISVLVSEILPQEKGTNDTSHLMSLMSVVNGNSSKNKLVAYQHKPHGVVGIIFVNSGTETIPLTTSTLVPMLMALANGNAVLIVSVGPAQSPPGRNFNEALKDLFPSGLVQFLQVENLKGGITALSQEGKVSLIWIIHQEGSLPDGRDDIPANAFSCIIVDNVSTLPSTVRTRGKFLNVTTAVYL